MDIQGKPGLQGRRVRRGKSSRLDENARKGVGFGALNFSSNQKQILFDMK
jgi:hypothetical protein